MNKIARFFSIALVTLIVVVIPVLAQDAPPAFPSCTDKIFTQDGDIAHYDYGLHQIVGGGLLEGADDVYSLGNNNALQCYCPVQGENNDIGIQTNWWDITGIAQQIIDNYTNQGWIFVPNGLQWNLNDGPYLAKNSNFSCIQTQPSPTPTEVPSSSPTPTPPSPSTTPTIAPTPTTKPQVQNTSVSVGGPVDAPNCPDPQPIPPTLLSVVKSGDDSVDLIWSSVTDARYYLISYGLESDQAQFGIPDVGNVTSYRIGGLDLDNYKYYFHVSVVKGCQVSEPSNEVSYPSDVGGQILGLADTGINFNLLKWWGILFLGLGMAFGSQKQLSSF